MENEKRNFHLFASLVNDTCADILLKCFVKKLEIAKTCFKDFLLDERHTFYHLLSEHKCCACTANTRTGPKCMYPAQWGCLYSKNRPPCKKHIDCICKYDVKTNVKSSELDISLCSILLLNSGILNTFESEKCHIKRIRKYRNDLAHNTSREIDINTFQSLWNEVALSVTQLARACSLELAVQTEEKINLARMPQQCYQEMAMIPESVEYENERGLILKTSVGAVHETVERLNQCLTPMLQQRVTHDITRIRARLMNDVYKDYIITNMDANIVIESMKNKGLFSNSDAQQLCNIGDIRNRSDRLLQILPSKDDAFVDSFLHSLLETQQHLIHSFIQGSDSRSKLRLIFECDIPQPHPVGVDLSLHIKLNNRFDLESKILDALQREADEINELTMMFANLSIHDIGKGSIIIRLKSENKNAIEKFYNAFLNGRVFGLFEEILKRISILDELIHDQVNVVVKISIDGIPKEPSTFFERNWKHLVDELSPRPVAALLLERGVLTKADIKEIFHADNLTRFSQSHSLIHNLNLEHNETMVDFKQCLSLTSQHYILKNAIVDDIPQVEPMLTSKVQDESSYTEEETKHSYSEKDTEHKCSTKIRKKQHPTEAISYKTRKIEVLEETEGTSYDSGATGPFTDVYGSDSDSDSCYDMGRPSLLKQFQVILDEYPDNSQILTAMETSAKPPVANEDKDKDKAIFLEFDTLCNGKQKGYSFNLLDSSSSANPTFGDLIRNIKKQLYNSVNAIENQSGKIVEEFSVGKSHAEQLKKGDTCLHFSVTDKNTWRLASGVNIKWSSFLKQSYDGLVTLCALTKESMNHELLPSLSAPSSVHDFLSKVHTQLLREFQITECRFVDKESRGGYKENTYAGVIFFVYKFKKLNEQATPSKTVRIADTDDDSSDSPLKKKIKVEYDETGTRTHKQKSLLAKRILKQGCMPLVPPARRDWENQDQIRLPCGIRWPPNNWKDLSCDTRRLLLEYTAMSLESHRLNTDLPKTNRRELLEKYNFLALTGSQLPKAECELSWVRYYNYETLRGIFNNPEDCNTEKNKFLDMMLAVKLQRDTSTDNLLDLIDDVPIKLDEQL